MPGALATQTVTVLGGFFYFHINRYTYLMNLTVYKYLFSTYGQRPGYWFGVFTDLTRGIMLRVWAGILTANLAANVAIGDFEAAKWNIILFFIVYVSGSAIGTIGELFAIVTENRVYEQLSIEYYKRLTNKDMAFYRDHQTGYLVSLFRQNLDSGMHLVRFFRSDFIGTVLALIAPTVVLFSLDLLLGFITLLIVIVQILYIFWSSEKANKYRALTHEIYRKITGEVSDQITNIIAFKSSGIEDKAAARLAVLQRQETDAFWARRKLGVLFDFPRDFLTAIGVAGAFWAIVEFATPGSGTIQLVVLTLTYMFQIKRNVSNLPHLVAEHDDLITKLYPTLAYATQEHELIRDPERPTKLAIKRGEIKLENVSFSYSSSDDNNNHNAIFTDLNLTIKGGERVGIVGLSGAGKSTFASLLMRFDEVTAGAILIDGMDIRKVRQAELRRQIAYVPQEPLLFHQTIRDNIAYGSEAASEQEIIKAATAAHAHEFIIQLPNGYDSMVGERGVKLSGGQKQRVVIARAVLKQASIMLFDEATSALDSESEQIIHQALPKIIGKHTAIIIAHRLSTVANLDRILVMDNGQIIEDGAHEQLLARNGKYASLWQRQQKSV